MNATVPLQEALPWSPDQARKILVCDSIETDGRFVLHTLAAEAFRRLPTQLWWLTGSPITDRQVAMALKKVGCDVAVTYLRNKNDSPLKITSLPTEFAPDSVSAESYLRGLYEQIKEWVESTQSPRWLFLDDVSSMAAILGESLVYRFVDTVGALATKRAFGLVIRCSLELDLKSSDDETAWLGAGGSAQKLQAKHHQQNWIPWERSIESMDAIVDVVPLASGYSREAHGRLVFSECPGGRGWGDKGSSHDVKWNKFVVNYCLNDSGARAIRLRSA